MFDIFISRININIFSLKWMYYGKLKFNSLPREIIVIQEIHLFTCVKWKIGNLPKIRAGARFIPTQLHCLQYQTP